MNFNRKIYIYEYILVSVVQRYYIIFRVGDECSKGDIHMINRGGISMAEGQGDNLPS